MKLHIKFTLERQQTVGNTDLPWAVLEGVQRKCTEETGGREGTMTAQSGHREGGFGCQLWPGVNYSCDNILRNGRPQHSVLPPHSAVKAMTEFKKLPTRRLDLRSAQLVSEQWVRLSTRQCVRANCNIFARSGIGAFYGKTDDEAAYKALTYSADRGMTFWDCADIYGTSKIQSKSSRNDN